MRIHKFGLICIGAFAVTATFVAIIFYINERSLLLQNVVDDLQRNVFQIEDEIKHALQGFRPNEVQKILDLAPVLNKNIANVALSKDHVVIDKSSARNLKGSLVDNSYIEFKFIQRELFNNQTKFKAPITYYENGKRVDGLLLVIINEHYVFGRLNQAAIFYIALVLFIIILGSYTTYLTMRQLIIRPLEQVTIHARDANALSEQHFITELSELDNTLTVSFEKLKSKKNELQASLNETLYLQEILQTVADINHLMISSESINDLLENSANRLAKHSGYNSCWIALDHDNDLLVEAISNESLGHIVLGQKLANLTKNSDDPICKAMLQGKSNVTTHLTNTEPQFAWQALSNHAQSGSFIAIPLRRNIHQQAIGVIGIYSLSTKGITPKELNMLEELAGDIGFAVNAFRQRHELEHHLTTCHLTDLPNRMSLVNKIEINPSLALALMNIDRFSEINDVYGIDIGDKFLVEFTKWLKAQVGPHPEISIHKLPGDEFGLVSNAVNNLDEFTVVLEDILNEIDKKIFITNDIEMLVSVTIGVAWPSKRVLEHAVQAVKEAKACRKRLQVYENIPHRQDYGSNLSWYKRIKSAIDDSRFMPYYHPIIDNKTKKIIKYEALIRLQDENGKVLEPYHFLDMSKKMRMYSQLTAIMVEKVCEKFKDQKIPVSVNLSIEDLLNEELVNKVEKIIIHYQMGSRIEFEILETENIVNYEEAKIFIERFRSLGCRFAIDDFGAGYSNFDQVLKLNVDTIKIDGSLIKNIQHDKNAKIFVHHFTNLARELGIKTIAEFVSNEDIYQIVTELGIDASQGYFFYKPSPDLIDESEV